MNALVADLAAEHGRVDLVGRRLACAPAARDALVDRFEAYGVLGGAGLRVHGDRGVLLVRYEEAGEWIEPGAERRPGESYRACARRALTEATGLEAALEDLAQLHLLYLEDGTGRPAVPNPYLVFRGRRTDGTPRTRDGVAATRWVDSVPVDLGYAELAELPLPE